MPITVVRCTHPGCPNEARYKVASPWQEGSFAEVQTLGYTCPDHTQKVVAAVQGRLKSRPHASPEIRVYTLPRA